MAMYLVFIPVVLGITAATIIARKTYLHCLRPQQEAITPPSAEDRDNEEEVNIEFTKSLETSDSIDDINFNPPKRSSSSFWFGKYTNLSKTETPTPDFDEEAQMYNKVIEDLLLYCNIQYLMCSFSGNAGAADYSHTLFTATTSVS